MDSEQRPRIPGLDPDEENPLHDRQPGDPVDQPEKEPEKSEDPPSPPSSPFRSPPVH